MANELPNERSGLITSRPLGLVDVLDRILDKGLVVAGDIKISLTNIELLTLQIRLIICSIDKAEQIGINWWRFDPNLTVPQRTEDIGGSEPVGELESEGNQLSTEMRGRTSVTSPTSTSATPRRRATDRRETGATKGKGRARP